MQICDYFKLKKKYNTLLNDYEVLKEDYERYKNKSKKLIKHLRAERRRLKNQTEKEN